MSVQPSTPGLAPAFEFLRAVHPEGIAPNRLLVWTMTGKIKESRWFPTIEAAAQFAARTDADAVYFGVGLSPQDFGPHHRCEADEIAALPGLVCDFDVYSPGVHEKVCLPPTMDEALRILPERFPPTIVWSTGHGVQAIWCFKEIWNLGSTEERERAAALSQRWHTYLAGEADRIKYTIDAVHDLSRVLRLPGSTNRKVPADPRPVEVIRNSGRRYDPSDLENILDTFGVPEIEVKATDERGRMELGDLRVSPCVELAPELDAKLKALLTNDPEFARVWNREKRMPKDSSWSGYALSIANLLAYADYTDQEIIDLLTHHWHHHRDAKTKRRTLSWFTTHTIPKARKAAKEQQERDRRREEHEAKRKESEQRDAQERAVVQEIQSGSQEKARAFLAETLDLPVQRLVQVGTDLEPSYKLVLRDERGERIIEIPSLATVNSFVGLDRFVWRYTGTPLPSKAKKKWREVRTALGKLIVVEDTGLGEIEVLISDLGEYFSHAYGFFEKYPASEHPDGPPSMDRGAFPFHGLVRAEDEDEFHVALRMLARPQKEFGAACGLYYLNAGAQSDTGGEVATVVFKLPPLYNWLRKYKDRKFEAAELSKRLSGAGFTFRQTTLMEGIRLKRVWRGTLADGAVDDHGFGDPEARWLAATRGQAIQ